jgi:hypothetical protein
MLKRLFPDEQEPILTEPLIVQGLFITGVEIEATQHFVRFIGDCLKIGGQAAFGTGADESLAGWNFCP